MLLGSREYWNLTPTKFLWRYINSAPTLLGLLSRTLNLEYQCEINLLVAILCPGLIQVDLAYGTRALQICPFNLRLLYCAALHLQGMLSWKSMWQLKAPHCADGMAICQTDPVFRCWCPVTDFVGGTEECPAAFERKVAAVQEGEDGLWGNGRTCQGTVSSISTSCYFDHTWEPRCGGNDSPSITSLSRTKLNIPKHRSKRNLKPFTISWKSRRLPDFLL